MPSTQSSESALTRKSCKACDGKVEALTEPQIAQLMGEIPGWERAGNVISKAYKFKNYYETIAFVNATAWISHREDHHPDLEVGYNACRVRYTTHSVNGLSENDFICAAKIETLLRL